MFLTLLAVSRGCWPSPCCSWYCVRQLHILLLTHLKYFRFHSRPNCPVRYSSFLISFLKVSFPLSLFSYFLKWRKWESYIGQLGSRPGFSWAKEIPKSTKKNFYVLSKWRNQELNVIWIKNITYTCYNKLTKSEKHIRLLARSIIEKYGNKMVVVKPLV